MGGGRKGEEKTRTREGLTGIRRTHRPLRGKRGEKTKGEGKASLTVTAIIIVGRGEFRRGTHCTHRMRNVKRECARDIINTINAEREGVVQPASCGENLFTCE